MAANSDLRAVLETSKGPIRVDLFTDRAPVTVASFVNLARRGFYDDLTFHRVIPDFMIQGGCPQGNGTGGPGYKFEDECHRDLAFDRPGLLAMANAGPATNGSQFFITHVPTDWLNGKHTIFGAVDGPEDQAIVDGIGQDDRIVRVTIEGEIAGLVDTHADRIASWNEALDGEYPDLPPAD